MNELRFLDALGMIDDDLLREADTDFTAPLPAAPSSRRMMTAAVSTAAVAALTLGAVALINGHRAKDMLTPPEQPAVNITPSSDGGRTPAAEDTTEVSTETGSSEAVSGTAAADSHRSSASGETVSTQTAGSGLSAASEDTPSAGTAAASESSPTAAGQQRTSDVTRKSSKTTTAVSSAKAPAQTTTRTTTAATAPTEGHKGGVQSGNCYWQPFAGYIDPDMDSYHEDEEHHVDIRTAEGFYRQLSTGEYAAQGIKSDISVTDFGGYIGKVAEVASTSEYHGGGAESQAPSLTGADVYYYAPAGNNKAFIIVRKNDQCSIFIADNIQSSSGFKKGMAFFGVEDSGDIQSIECRIMVPDNGLMAVLKEETITDPGRIKAVYDILCELIPEDYSKLPEHIGTPPWLTAAYEAYRNDPNAPQRTDHSITIKLKDGTVLEDILYQPYIGNGYVQGMEELTPEQNAALRELV
ncbi:MAG: hypothetical protein J5501_01285 [Ruminococcus sp.]|nr:hypothetical protein [Ruminococcus sp.]